MVLCVVIDCHNRSERDKHVSYYRIPAVLKKYGKSRLELSKKCQAGFLAAISREDIDKKSLSKYRICSKHFVSGRPAKRTDETTIDWLPTLHMGHEKRKQTAADTSSRLERYDRARRRSNARLQQEEAAMFYQQMEVVCVEMIAETASDIVEEIAKEMIESLEIREAAVNSVVNRIISEEISVEHIVREEFEAAMIAFGDGRCKCVEKITELEKELQKCRSIIDELSRRVMQILPPFSEETLKDDMIVNFYTGLPNLKVVMAIFNHVCITLPGERTAMCKLTNFQQFMLVMVKLRLNSPMVDLAYRFGVSPATVSRIFLKWLTQMDIRLKSLIIWPERDNLQKTMPNCFQVSFGKKVAIVIDCFEVFLERPSNLRARASTWSNYKHRNTVKILLGIVPQGAIAFVSKAWGGRVSDKHLTEHSGFLNKLLPGDIVLADRGFDIAESVGMRQARLHIPAFTKGKSQLSAMEVEETRAIANVPIHVERVIGMVRQKYSILHGTLPIDFVIKKAGEDVPLIDRIVCVCCALTNVCNPIVPID